MSWKFVASGLSRCLASVRGAGVLLAVAGSLSLSAQAQTPITYTGEVDNATGAFTALTPIGTPVGGPLVVDDAALAAGSIGVANIQSIDVNVGGFCFATGTGTCGGMGTLVPIESIDSANITGTGGTLGGSFQVTAFSPTFMVSIPISFDLDGGTFSADGGALGTVGGTGILEAPSVPTPDIDTNPAGGATLDFGSVVVGDAAATQTINVSNIGDEVLNIGSVVLTGNPADLALTEDCTGALAATTGTCTVTLTLTPVNAAALNATVTINSDDPDEMALTYTVTGEILTPAALTSDATMAMPLLLDSVAIGGASTGIITVTNSGGATATLGTVGTPAAPFSLTANDLCSGATLMGAETCTIEVQFMPTMSGAFDDSFSVDIASTVPGFGGLVTAATMFVASSTLDPVATPSALVIADTMVSDTSTGTLTITNSGEAPLTITGATGLSAPFSSDDAACIAASPIAPMGTCDITVTFEPTAEGNAMGTLSVASNDPASPLDVAVMAVGTEQLLPNIMLSSDMVNFATPLLIGEMAMDTVTVTNTGTADLTISAIAVAPTTDFALADDCAAVLVPMGSCTVTVTFAPMAGGPLAATLTIDSDDGDTPQASVALTGTGIVPEPNIMLSTAMLDLGVLSIGDSNTDTVTVTNMGTANLTISSVTIPMGDYSQVNTCEAAPLTPMGTCTVTVTFSPSVDATVVDTLTIVSDDPDSMMSTVSLTGRGVTAPEPNVASSASSLDLGTGLFGVTLDGELTITNSGNADLVISNVAVSGADAGEFTPGGDCVGTLVEAATCTVTVAFSPAAPEGAKTATLSVVSNDADTPSLDIALSGVAEMPVPAAEFSVTMLDFGDVTLGDSATQMVTVSSNGTGPLTVTSSTLSGAMGSPFTISADTCAVVATGSSCDVSVTFAPMDVDDFTDTLTINSDDPDAPSATVMLSGSGIAVPAPDINTDVAALAFGDVLFGMTGELTLTVTNTGDADLTVTSATIPAGEFSALSTCGVVMPAATCTVTVTYTPATEGDVASVLTIASDDADTPSIEVALTGTGVPLMPEIEFSADALDFGSIVAESTRVEELTISNTGMADLVIGGITLSGADQALFTQTSDCDTLAMGESCVVEVTFSPLVAGDATAILTVVSDDADEGSVDFVLTAMATPVPMPMIDVVEALDFGDVDGGQTASETVTISNAGTADLVITDIALTGDGAAQFSQTSQCGTVEPGSSCEIAVEFTPVASGDAAAELVITSNDVGSPATVALTASGLVPVPMLSATSVDLGNVSIGRNGTGTLTIGNDGNADLVIVSAVLSGADAQDFVLDNGCGTVAQGETCTITATFTPQSEGAKMATITLTTNDPAQATITVPLSAVATPMEEVVVSVNSQGGSGSFGLLELIALFAFAGLVRRSSLRTVTVALAAFCAPLAMADNHESANSGYWYAGVGFGSSDGQSDLGAIERGIENAGVTVNSLSIDDSDSGYKVFTGYQASEHIAVEVGYVDLGEAAIDLQLGDVALEDLPLISRSVSGNLALLGSGVFGSVVVSQSITDSIGVFARAGLVSWEVDTAIGGGTSTGTLNISETESGTDFTFGIGADAWFGEQRKFGVRGEWERFELGEQDAEFLSLSIMYRF